MQTVRRDQRSRRHAIATLAGLTAVAYAWWATSVRPFTSMAYLAVGVPVLVALARASFRPVREPPQTVRASPERDRRLIRRAAAFAWATVACAAVVLESLALALGGSSRSVPSLSTVVDQALAWHLTRALLFLVWAGVGALLAWGRR